MIQMMKKKNKNKNKTTAKLPDFSTRTMPRTKTLLLWLCVIMIGIFTTKQFKAPLLVSSTLAAAAAAAAAGASARISSSIPNNTTAPTSPTPVETVEANSSVEVVHRTPTKLTRTIRDNIHAFMNRTIQQRPLPPDTPGAFLHVGKAGGSTVSLVLQNGCHSFVRKPCARRQHWEDGTRNETYVGALTTYIHTPDFHRVGQTPQYSNFDFYVIMIRDPFSRFLSAFTYMHPGNSFVGIGNRKVIREPLRKFFSCFPSLERFTELVGDRPMDFDYPVHNDTIHTHNCTNLARAAMANQVKKIVHFYWNTNTILERIPGWNNNGSSSFNSSRPTPPPLMAIRTEYASQDFFTANSVLGDPHPLDLYAAGAAGAINNRVQPLVLNVSKNISSVGRRRLCKALRPEYKSYITALARAINLSDQDRQNSLKLSQQTCPDNVWLSQQNFIR